MCRHVPVHDLADRLTMLGPRPIIASLSLGARRTFRLKCMAQKADSTAQPESVLSEQQQQQQTFPAVDAKALGCLQSTGAASGIPGNRVLHAQAVTSEGLVQPHQQEAQSTLHGRQQTGVQDCIMDTSQQMQSCKAQAVASVDVQLPHNTLVIMWPPMQEAWKHEVSFAFTLACAACAGATGKVQQRPPHLQQPG